MWVSLLHDKRLLSLELAISGSKAKIHSICKAVSYLALSSQTVACPVFFAAVSAGQSARVMEEIVV